MRRILRAVVLFFRKTVFYLGVAGRKTLALLLTFGLALFYFGAAWWLHLVIGMTLLGDIVVMSDRVVNKGNYLIAVFVYAVIPFFVYEAIRLILIGIFALSWTEEDYFDFRTSSRKASFLTRQQ